MARYDVYCEECGIGEVARPMAESGVFTCPSCGGEAFRLWTIHHVGAKIAPNDSDSPIEHQKWFHSEETQARLRSGELEVVSKSSDLGQHR